MLDSEGDRVTFNVYVVSVTEEYIVMIVSDENPRTKECTWLAKNVVSVTRWITSQGNCPNKKKQQTETDGGNVDATNDATETRNTYRPPD